LPHQLAGKGVAQQPCLARAGWIPVRVKKTRRNKNQTEHEVLHAMN